MCVEMREEGGCKRQRQGERGKPRKQREKNKLEKNEHRLEDRGKGRGGGTEAKIMKGKERVSFILESVVWETFFSYSGICFCGGLPSVSPHHLSSKFSLTTVYSCLTAAYLWIFRGLTHNGLDNHGSLSQGNNYSLRSIISGTYLGPGAKAFHVPILGRWRFIEIASFQEQDLIPPPPKWHGIS